jgi:hypothetical protein
MLPLRRRCFGVWLNAGGMRQRISAKRQDRRVSFTVSPERVFRYLAIVERV